MAIATLLLWGITAAGMPQAARGPRVGAPLPDVAPVVSTVTGPDRPDGRPRIVRLSARRSVTLRPFRVAVAVPGVSARCGVAVDRQRIMTLGIAATRALGCDRLVAAGALTPSHGMQRIGLLYTAMADRGRVRAAVVLIEEGGAWRIDGALAGRFDGTPAARSIAALRAASAR